MKFDIAVVGGGMVGASFALKLAQAGLSVVLLEKHPAKAVSKDESFDLRISAINRRSETWLRELGAWQLMHPERICVYQQLRAFEQEQPPLDFTAAEIAEPYLGHMVENNQIQAALWQQFPTTLTTLCPATVNSIQHHPDFVSLKTEEHGEIIAKLVIGADGANSQIRQLAGIGSNGWQYQQACMLIHIQTAYPHLEMTWQQFTEQGPRAYLPLPGHDGSLVWYDDANRIAQLAAMSTEQLHREITQHFPQRLGEFTVLKQAWFPLVRSDANQYVKGRVVLMGDAAHTINPLAGQGVNLGFADAQLFAQLLIEAWQKGEDLASQRVLSSYQRQRKIANLTMMSAMDVFYQVFKSELAPVRQIRRLGLALAAKAGPLKAWVGKYAAGVK